MQSPLPFFSLFPCPATGLLPILAAPPSTPLSAPQPSVPSLLPPFSSRPGLLPILKELVEVLFQEGLVKARPFPAAFVCCFLS